MKQSKVIALSIALLLLFSTISSLFLIQAHATGIALVQGPCRGTAYNSNGVSSCSVTMTSTPTSGNTLIAIVGLDLIGGEHVSSIAESNVVWTKAAGYEAGGDADAEIWYGLVSSGASKTVTVTLTAPTGEFVVDICEWSGLAISSQVDQTATNHGSSKTMTTGTTATTTQTNELWVGAICSTTSASDGGQSSPTNSFTLLDGAGYNPASGCYMSLGYLYYVASAAGTAGSGTTSATSSGLLWSGCIATFKTSLPKGIYVSLDQPTNNVTVEPAVAPMAPIVAFNYTPVSINRGAFTSAQLWTNAGGTWHNTASNSTKVLNATLNTISYTFSSFGSYVWNVKVSNGTSSVFAASNYTVTLTLNFYPMSSSSTMISGNPSNQHAFNVVHTTNIAQCNVVVDGATRTYLGYDTGYLSNVNLYYSNSINGTWTAYSGNPVITESCQFCSVSLVSGTFQMFLHNTATNDIEYWTSTNGITWTLQTAFASGEEDPYTWLNPNDNHWYLFSETQSSSGPPYWFAIVARNATTVAGLTSATRKVVLNVSLSSGTSILWNTAAPSIAYINGYYWLMTEGENGHNTPPWHVNAWYSTSVTSGYKLTANSPILTDDEACPRLQVADNGVTVYLFTNQNSTSDTWYQWRRTVHAVLSLSSVSLSPSSVTLDANQNQVFSTSISGGTSPFTYHWYKNGTLISGANSSSYTFSSSSKCAFSLYVNVTDSESPAVTVKSNTASITVNSAPTVTISPTSATIYANETQTFTSTVSNGTTPYSYQWYKNGTAVSGATSSSWSFTPITSGQYNIKVKVTDALSYVVNSSSSVLTVLPATSYYVAIVSNATSIDQTQSVSFTSTVSGGTSPYTYQWCTNGAAVSGATNSTWTWTTTTSTTSGTYQVYLNVTDSLGNKRESNTVTITVNTLPSVSITPAIKTMDLTQSVTFSSTASGGTPTYTYQWYLNGAQVPGATSNSWTFAPSSTGSDSVYAVITDSVGKTATSNTASVTVNPTLTVSVSPSSVSLNVSQSKLFNSTVSGGTSPYTYQWYQNGTAISGAISSSYTFTPSSPGNYNLYLNVTDSANAKVQSNTATATVKPTSAKGIALVQGPCRSTAYGSVSSLVVTMTSVPKSGDLLIATVGLNLAAGEHISSITETGVSWSRAVNYINSGWAGAEIWYGVVGSGASTSITVTLTAATPQIVVDICEWSGLSVSSPVDQTATNHGTSTTMTTGTTAATTQANELWIGTICATTSASAGAQSSPTNSFALLDGAGYNPASGYYMSLGYLYYVTSAAGTAGTGTTASTSTGLSWSACIATFKATVTSPSLSVSISPSSVVLDVNQSQTFTSSVTGGTPPYSYQWCSNNTAIGGATNSSYTFTPSSPGNYNLYVNVTDSANAKAQSNTATATVVTAATGITLVQGPCRNTAYGSVSSISVTMTSAPKSGDLLIAIIGLNLAGGEHVSSIAESNVVWTKAAGYEVSGGADAEIWYGVVGSGASTSVTITLTAATPQIVVDICEWSGLSVSSPVDQTATNSGRSTTMTTGTTATTTQTNELCVGAVCATSSGTDNGQSSPTNGFTLLDGAGYNPASGYCMSLGYLYYVTSATGTAGSGTTASTSAGLYWSGCIATFKAAVN